MYCYKILFHIIFFLFCFSSLFAEMKEELLRGTLVEGITVDLREPTYCEGVLTTTKGGVITGPRIRIQAKEITYTRKEEEGVPVCHINAEEEIMLELGNYIFVGERLYYDFQNRTGLLYSARTGFDNWFIGGTVIELYPDDTYVIHNGYVTTTETCKKDWQITVEKATYDHNLVSAKNVQFQLMGVPLFWLPKFHLDLDHLHDSPIKYKAGWGGKQGPRVGMSYEIFSWNRWKTYVRLDYRLNRGLGGGIETYYRSPDHKETFESINYIARDNSIYLKREKIRYRVQGAYHNILADDKVTMDLTYDKLSDKYMATDYEDQGLELENPIRTQLDLRRQERNWIANLTACVRVNSFETLKQELPTFKTSWRPFELGSTGIISDNQLALSYLDFVYAHQVPEIKNYHATRLSFFQNLYRPFIFEPLIITPFGGTRSIYYGNSPGRHTRWLLVGMLGCNINVPFYRYYGGCKHNIIPYIHYHYDAYPTVAPDHHYIFDIEDGWYRLHQLRFGVKQNLFSKECSGELRRILYSDIYADAFFDSHKIPGTIPRAYANLTYNASPTIRHTLSTGVNFFRGELDFINLRTQWTVNKDFAVAVEFRHRDSYCWRKADRDNFMLDAFRSVRELRHSQVSDRRDTALLHFFYRFHPNWALEFESRHGWLRRNHTRYTEFEVDLLGNLRSSSRLKLSYQHNEGEDRVAVYFTVGLDRPDRVRSSDCIPQIEM